MKKQFGLQKVLDFRNKTLDREKIKLTELYNKSRMMIAQMSEISDEIKMKQAEQDNEVAEGRLEFSVLYNKYIEVRIKDFELVKQNHDQLLTQIEAQKEILRKTLNDVKIMDKLKEKHLANFAKYMSKQEELQIDEVNITKRRDEAL